MNGPISPVGQNVLITWNFHNNDDSWHHYTVIAFCPPLVLLRGRTSDTGTPFTGKDFWTNLDQIDLMEVDK